MAINIPNEDYDGRKWGVIDVPDSATVDALLGANWPDTEENLTTSKATQASDNPSGATLTHIVMNLPDMNIYDVSTLQLAVPSLNVYDDSLTLDQVMSTNVPQLYPYVAP